MFALCSSLTTSPRGLFCLSNDWDDGLCVRSLANLWVVGYKLGL